MEPEASIARHARSGPVVEVERVDGLEGVLVEERTLVGVEAALVLGKRVGPGLDGGYAAGPELAGHVAEAGPEEERDPGRVAGDRAELPAAEYGVGGPPPVEVLPPLPEGQVVNERRRDEVRDVVRRQRPVTPLFEG